MIRYLIIFAVIFSSTVWGATVCDMDTTQPIRCNFSSRMHNRIFVEKGRVSKLIYPEEKLFIRMEEFSGQVFVQSRSCNQRETVLVTAVTDKGDVQDIEITFGDFSPCVVLLRPAGSFSFGHENNPVAEVSPYFQSVLDSIVEDISHHRIPEGYCSVPFIRCSWIPKTGISAKLVGKLRGDCEDIFVYQLFSTTPWKKRIHERELADSSTEWAYIEQPCLKGKQGTIAIVAKNHA